MHVFLTAVLLLLPAQDPADAWREVDLPFPWASPVDREGRPLWLTTRIVDRTTGRPIPGATVTAAREHPTPLAGEFWGTRTVTADADGWVRMRLDDLGGEPQWMFFQAPGYGAVAQQGPVVEYPQRLLPGVDVPIEVRDAFDRPVRARVGLLLGCGHTPDLQTVDTDPRGAALLRCVAIDTGELWPVADGLFSEYTSLEGWEPGDAPLRLRMTPAPVFQGLVLDAKGQPVAGIPVGAPRCHRGPWTRTGPDGSFRLLGAEAMAELQILPPGATPGMPLRWQPSPDGQPCVVRIPAPEDPPLATLATASVRVRVRTWPVSGPAVLVQVFAVRVSDGLCDLALTNEEGEAELKVPPGDYRLHAEGWLSGLGRTQQALRATEDGTEAELKVAILPLAVVQVHGLPKHGRVVLTTPRGEREITDLVHAGKPLPAPEDDAVFRLEADGRDKIVPCPKGLGLMAPRPFELHWYQPTRITLRVTGPDGAPAAARALLEPGAAADPDGAERHAAQAEDARAELALATTRKGRATVFVLPDAPGLHATRLRVRLPESEGQTVDLGEIRLSPKGAAPLRVTLPDGTPPGILRVVLRRPDGGAVGNLLLDGTWDPEFLVPRAGDRIEVSAPDGFVALEQTLAGAGPWLLTWPDTTLTVTAHSEEGAPIEEFVLVRSDDLDAGKGGTLTLRGLPVGRHDVVVAATDCLAWRGPVTLTPGVPVTVARTLPKRRRSGG